MLCQPYFNKIRQTVAVPITLSSLPHLCVWVNYYAPKTRHCVHILSQPAGDISVPQKKEPALVITKFEKWAGEGNLNSLTHTFLSSEVSTLHMTKSVPSAYWELTKPNQKSSCSEKSVFLKYFCISAILSVSVWCIIHHTLVCHESIFSHLLAFGGEQIIKGPVCRI